MSQRDPIPRAPATEGERATAAESTHLEVATSGDARANALPRDAEAALAELRGAGRSQDPLYFDLGRAGLRVEPPEDDRAQTDPRAVADQPESRPLHAFVHLPPREPPAPTDHKTLEMATVVVDAARDDATDPEPLLPDGSRSIDPQTTATVSSEASAHAPSPRSVDAPTMLVRGRRPLTADPTRRWVGIALVIGLVLITLGMLLLKRSRNERGAGPAPALVPTPTSPAGTSISEPLNEPAHLVTPNMEQAPSPTAFAAPLPTTQPASRTPLGAPRASGPAPRSASSAGGDLDINRKSPF